MEANKCDGSHPQPATVLVLDADAVFREFEARTLSDLGYHALKASGRADALRLSAQNPNVGLLLHGSPIRGHDTLEFIQQFRRAHPGAPVLLALWSLEGFDERFNNLGRVSVMAKPFELIELINNVRRLLAQVHEPSTDHHRDQTLSQAVSPILRRARRGEAQLADRRVPGLLAFKRIEHPDPLASRMILRS
jgi:DNA-binding response OmpR family regulator